jgi:hypothetical protein
MGRRPPLWAIFSSGANSAAFFAALDSIQQDTSSFFAEKARRDDLEVGPRAIKRYGRRTQRLAENKFSKPALAFLLFTRRRQVLT